MDDVGTRIGLGRTAEVLAFGEDRVAKVMLPGFPTRFLDQEERRTRAAFDAGAPAPAVFDRITHDGRTALVMERLDGIEMLADLAARPWRVRRWAQATGALHAAIHGHASADLPDIKEVLAAKIGDAEDLPSFYRTAAKNRLRLLPDGGSVLHGDFHPGNIILTPGTPTPIDWMDASGGPPEPDLVRTLWLLSDVAIPTDMPRRRLAVRLVNSFRRHYLTAYVRKTNLDRSLMAPWRLPVFTARISEQIPEETPTLVASVKKLVDG